MSTGTTEEHRRSSLSHMQAGQVHPRQAYRFALLIPFIWQLGLAPLVNDISWQPFGLPFQMLWQMAGVVVASLSVGFVFSRDTAAASRAPQ